MPMPYTRIPQTDSALSLPTRAIVHHLSAMQEGETVSYAMLNALAQVDVQRHRSYIQSARRYLQATKGQVFAVNVNVGLLCLSNSGKLTEGRKERRRLHTQAIKTTEIYKAVEVKQLTPLEQHCWLAEVSVAAAVSLATHDDAVRQLEGQSEPMPLLIDPTAYRDVFQGI